MSFPTLLDNSGPGKSPIFLGSYFSEEILTAQEVGQVVVFQSMGVQHCLYDVVSPSRQQSQRLGARHLLAK